MELGSVEDEEDHRESDTNDLDDQEYHDTLRRQSSHVEHQGGFKGCLGHEDTNVDVVAVTSKESVHEAFDDD